VLKEEGQLLIHTAQSWGEKTMTNTSMDGREMIRQELQQLQQEWDVMIGEKQRDIFCRSPFKFTFLTLAHLTMNGGMYDKKWKTLISEKYRDNLDISLLNKPFLTLE